MREWYDKYHDQGFEVIGVHSPEFAHEKVLENVQAALDWATEAVGAPPIAMPHINGTRKGHYAQYYTPTTREMVADICRQDIEYFGYSFEQQPAVATGDVAS